MIRAGTDSPIRVVIIDNAMSFGGTLSVVRNVVRHLDSDKIQVTVITACSEPFLDVAASNRTKVYICRPYANYKRTHVWYSAIERRLGGSWLRGLFNRLVFVASLIANVPYSLRVGALCIRAGADIVHYNQAAIETIWITKFLRVRAVLHLHVLLPNPLPVSTRMVLRNIHAYIAISNCVYDAAVQAAVPETLIHRIPNFVEQSLATPPSLLPAAPTIGIFGRVIPWKGQKEFLAAARMVMRRFPDVYALVVGDAADWESAYLEDCVRAVREWGLSGRVEFTGMVRDVTSFYRRCSVVVHASIEPEPFGMVIIEAMAQGRPVVASALGAGAEIVRSSGGGLIADPRSPEELAEKICILLSDRQLAQEMGTRGFREVQQHYDPRVIARRFESVYQSVFRSSSRRMIGNHKTR
jgi:glycosyltransferase involved in cell wall biosynthesis